MTIIAEQSFFHRRSHRGTGSSTGAVVTNDHMIVPVAPPGFLSVHVGLSRLQATTDGPIGAAVGIMSFGNQDFGPDPANWRPVISGNVGAFTTAFQVNKGDMSAWEFFQAWA